MTKSTQKPAKPHPEFPLYAHKNGQWAKKVAGATRFFGVWDDPEAALDLYLFQRDYLVAGKVPPPYHDSDRLTVKELCNLYIAHKKKELARGKIKTRAFEDAEWGCEEVLRTIGGRIAVDDVDENHFSRIRKEWDKKYAPNSIKTRLTKVRGPFNYAMRHKLVDKLIVFGDDFVAPSNGQIEEYRERKHKKNPAMLQQPEIATLLNYVIETDRVHDEAKILLALNCSFHGPDLGELEKSQIDLEYGWVELPRSKTRGLRKRRCPLWPETVDAIKRSMKERQRPKNRAFQDRVFVTEQGQPWFREENGEGDCAWTQRLSYLFKQVGLKRPGVKSYGLRKVLPTIGRNAKDEEAIDQIMGHRASEKKVARDYVDFIEDERLVAITDAVYEWVFGEPNPHKHRSRPTAETGMLMNGKASSRIKIKRKTK